MLLLLLPVSVTSLSIHFFQSHPSSKNRKHITGYSLNGVNIQKNLRISISDVCLTPYLIKKKKMQKSLYVVFYHKDKNTRSMKHLSYSLLLFFYFWGCSSPKCFILCCKKIASNKTGRSSFLRKQEQSFEWQKLVNSLEENAIYVYV